MWDLDENGQVVAGNGSDEKLFLVGVTSKALFGKQSETHDNSSPMPM
ncbi:hypothetical protein PI124_g16275 [Phytophthora idaei]|nr:hypothetical protein PI125_g15540 [Phytophthora idaei]KAG3138046.1 hypothetical protein PI126_g17092 [Phytophthora idaei]KAG3238775.1 hypothetical protein PI124_g16275 [Phytophthora idaei]